MTRLCWLAVCSYVLAAIVALLAVVMSNSSNIPCGHFLGSWYFWTGASFLCVSFMGVIAGALGLRRTLMCYMAVAFVMTVTLTAILIASWVAVITKDGDGRNFWKQKMGSLEKWAPIKGCLSEARLCESLSQREDMVYISCCQVPSSMHDPDASRWDSNTTILCYFCDSCKNAIFNKLQSDWRRRNIAFSCLGGLLIAVYVVQVYFYKKERQIPLPLHQQHQMEQLQPQQQQQQQEAVFRILDSDDELDDESPQTEHASLIPQVEMTTIGR